VGTRREPAAVRAVSPGRRRAGSVRFAPYYKVQWRDERLGAWVDVQRQHASLAEARAAFLPGVRCRVMEITMAGRRPLPEA
jgi:hypothetical protein